MTTQDAKKVMEHIAKNAESSSDAPKFLRNFEIGKVIRQGDCYLQCVEAPKFEELTPTDDRQLAPGNSQGSRHIIEAGEHVKIYKDNSGDPLMGPWLNLGARTLLTHPEHSDISLPAGTYKVRYQQDVAAEERARVMD